jgi:hypothetical protein
MRKFTGVMIAFVLCLPFLGWATTRVVQDIQFDRNVEGHLKRAADANTIELAEEELAGVIAYLEQTGMTTGYTSILWRTPDEDIGFWYRNLKASLDELRKAPKEATQLENSNLLIKLRETLVDHGRSIEVTVPPGASIFPNNAVYSWWSIFGFVMGIIGVIVGAAIILDD